MSDKKSERVESARLEAADRRQKAIVSLAHCLGRCDVYRLHHDALIHEVLAAGGSERFTDAKKLRFAAYVCSWFAGLATVIERFQQLVNAGTLPKSEELSTLISADYLDLLKPFRNAVAHCPDHDDERVLALLNTPFTSPDRAANISHAFKRYFELHSTRPIYTGTS
jgi:hypothetical protein